MISPRKAVLSLPSYQVPPEGRVDKVRLDYNENTTGFPQYFPSLPAVAACMYPEYGVCVSHLADFWEVTPSRVLLTNGSDEALALIAQTFIEPDFDHALIASPTFMMIPHYLKLAQAHVIAVQVTDELAFDIGAITQSLEQGVKLAVFPSPDNPTGAMVSTEQVRGWCERFPQTLFVIDEAYAEYADQTVLPLIAEFQNLLVTRTFSKAWGLAGLRLGAILGHPDVIEPLKRVQSPYSVNSVAVQAVQAMLPNAEAIYQAARETMGRKERVITELRTRGFRVHDTAANFFLLALGIEIGTFVAFCELRGVLVRDRSALPRMWGMVRVTVGSDEDMATFLACLHDYYDRRALIFDLDDTLIDTGLSYDRIIADLVLAYSVVPLEPDELKTLRTEVGFNDDWDSAIELLRRRGVEVARDVLEPQAKVRYLSVARSVETLLFNPAILERLRTRYRLLIVTGRPRDEFTPVWADRLHPMFDRVYCQDDFPNAQRKPAPDLLTLSMADASVTGGIYVGNSVDDMQASSSAGLIGIGVMTTLNETLLQDAGATIVLQSVNDVGKVVMP